MEYILRSREIDREIEERLGSAGWSAGNRARSDGRRAGGRIEDGSENERAKESREGEWVVGN